MAKTKPMPCLQPLSQELAGAKLGDRRLDRRLGVLADQLSERATETFPKALTDDLQLEAAYRFFGNERVTPEAILEPHFAGAAARAASRSTILVLHDTSEFEFSGEVQREGLGRLLRTGQGFFGHFSLAVDAAPTHEPFGLLAFESIFRHGPLIPRKKRKKAPPLGESARWVRGVEAAQKRLPATVRAIHVKDREGDSYSILAAMAENEREYVIRSNHDRILAGVARPVIPGPNGARAASAPCPDTRPTGRARSDLEDTAPKEPIDTRGAAGDRQARRTCAQQRRARLAGARAWISRSAPG